MRGRHVRKVNGWHPTDMDGSSCYWQAVRRRCEITVAAKMRQILNLVGQKASAIKATIEGVQCTAIDAELTLMGSSTSPDGGSIQHVQRQLVEALDSVADEVATLLRLIRADPTTPGTRRLQ